MTDRPSSAPPFKHGTATWTCWVKNDGCYEWRSDCGRMFVWREGRYWRARLDSAVHKQTFADVKEAMSTAENGRRRSAA